MKTFHQLYQELKEAHFEDIKVGDNVGSKMHKDDKATYFHGTVIQVRAHPIYGHEVLYKTGEDKYGDVVHSSPISHIVKESQPSTFVSSSGGKTASIKHRDNDELTRFLKSDEGEGHMFIGKDEQGKPHSAKMTESIIPLYPIGSKVRINRPKHWAHGKIAKVMTHFGMGHHSIRTDDKGEYTTFSGKDLELVK
jgi:hypothetical protein